jgi:hypothetical protein
MRNDPKTQAKKFGSCRATGGKVVYIHGLSV